jgi:hypothetical protein
MIKKEIELQRKINDLDKNKIHLLFFNYSVKENWLKKPFLLIFKLFFKVQNKPAINHCCHISRFIYDNENGNWLSRVFEANMNGGVQENDLFDKLKYLKGKVYIITLGDVDKIKAKEFEQKYLGIPYSLKLAGLSGLDFKFLDSIDTLNKSQSGFCSWLVALFLMNQGYDLSKIENGNPLEMTPTDLYLANLGEIKLFYEA